MTNLDTAVSIDISSEWLAIAEQFATEQTQVAQQEIIFQQTLAVLGLQKYLELADIKTALTESYSWHPQTRTLTAWADLLLPEFGRLLCCFANTSQQVCLPPILPLNTFGFVVVEINTNFSTVYLTGFLPYRDLAHDRAQFSIEETQLISTLFDELYLLSEKRLLVEIEVQQAISTNQDLQNYFSTFLAPENLVDIVNRLNHSFALDGFDSNNLLLGESADLKHSAYAVTESVMENYGESLAQERIITATTQLTQSLLTKIRELHQDFELTERHDPQL